MTDHIDLQSFINNYDAPSRGNGGDLAGQGFDPKVGHLSQQWQKLVSVLGQLVIW